MLKRLAVLAALSLCSCGAALAQSMSFSFTQGGYSDGAAVTGLFMGDDLNGDGQLVGFGEGGEISDAEMAFSGNSDVTGFSLGFDDLFGIVYDLDGGPLGDGVGGAIEGMAFAGLMGEDYEVGPGPVGVVCGEGNVCAFVSDGLGTDSSTQLVMIGGAAPGTNPANAPSTEIANETLNAQTAGIQPAIVTVRSNDVMFRRTSSPSANSVSSVNFGAEEGAAAGDDEGGFQGPSGAWISVSRTQVDDNFVSTAFESQIFNVTGGVDWFVDDRLLMGLGFGYANQDTDTRLNSGNADSDQFSIIPYLGYLFNDYFSGDVSGGYTWAQIDQSRRIGGATFDSDPDGDGYFVAGNLNVFHAQGPWSFTGTAGLLYAESNVDSFDERIRGTSITVSNSSSSSDIGQWRVGATGAYYVNGFEPFLSLFYVEDFTRSGLNLAAGVPQPEDDDNEAQFGGGLRYIDDAHGVTASAEYIAVLGRNDIDSNSVHFLITLEL